MNPEENPIHDPSGAHLKHVPALDAKPPVRDFVDVDGIEWEVEWCDAETVRRRMRATSSTSAGLVFATKADALIFHLPMRYSVDPRLLTTSQLSSMIDHAFDCVEPKRS